MTLEAKTRLLRQLDCAEGSMDRPGWNHGPYINDEAYWWERDFPGETDQAVTLTVTRGQHGLLGWNPPYVTIYDDRPGGATDEIRIEVCTLWDGIVAAEMWLTNQGIDPKPPEEP